MNPSNQNGDLASILTTLVTLVMSVLGLINGAGLPGMGVAPVPGITGTAGAVTTPTPGVVSPTDAFTPGMNPTQGPVTASLTPGGGTPASTDLGPFVFPIAGPAQFTDDYQAHVSNASGSFDEGIDIFAERGTPMVAPVSGTVSRSGPSAIGGNRLHIVRADGTDFYFAHLDQIAPGISDGVSVQAGQTIGTVGDTGNAQGTSPHLHFSVVRNGASINPYAALRAAQAAAGTQIAQAP